MHVHCCRQSLVTLLQFHLGTEVNRDRPWMEYNFQSVPGALRSIVEHVGA
jgi:hypothetical protein